MSRIHGPIVQAAGALAGLAMLIVVSTTWAQAPPGEVRAPGEPPVPVQLPTAPAQPAPIAKEPVVFEVILEGKIHEAFAAPTDFFHEPPAPSPKVPPAMLVEAKPSISAELQKKAVWIPGYWTWDDAAEEFVWITGVWRFPPPGRQWVPGRWVTTDEGYVRVHGFWRPATVTEVSYVSAPPAYQGNFPLRSSLAADQMWIPGCWVPAEGDKFAWREGFVARRVENWDWVAAQYHWTPDGWIFIDGYWDYPLPARGQTFTNVKVVAKTYDNDRTRMDRFVPLPSTAIQESSSGAYVYSVKELEEETHFAKFELGEREVPNAPVMIAHSLPAAATATVRGIVHRGPLTPDGIEVELIGHATGRVTTDEQGRFEFTNVPYGVYLIRAAGPVQNLVRRGFNRIEISQPVVEARLELH